METECLEQASPTPARAELHGVGALRVEPVTVEPRVTTRSTLRTRTNGSFDVLVVLDRVGIRAGRPDDVAEHVALVRGDVTGDDVPLRVSSACVMSTALGSAECDCAQQLDAAVARIATVGRGVVIYLADQEGRGHGLTGKIKALGNKNAGMDTFAAAEALGVKADVRSYAAVRDILEDLGVRSVVLLTNNPEKACRIEEAGVKVTRLESLEVEAPAHARRHMEAKRHRGHLLTMSHLPQLPATT